MKTVILSSASTVAALLSILWISNPSQGTALWHQATYDKTAPLCPSRPATTAQQEVIWAEFVDTFYHRKDPVAAFDRHVGEDYVQHNPHLEQGPSSALQDLLVPLFNSGINFTFINDFFGQNRGVVHLRSLEAQRDKPLYVVDIYRFEGTCMVEHWDVMQEEPTNPINTLAMM